MPLDRQTCGDSVSPSGVRPIFDRSKHLRRDSVSYTPGSFPEGASSSDILSFAHMYPSGVAPCYSQGLICIDAECICHTAKDGIQFFHDKARRENLDCEALPQGFSNLNLDSNQDVSRRAPESTVINKTSARSMSGTYCDKNIGGTTGHTPNVINGAHGHDSRHATAMGFKGCSEVESRLANAQLTQRKEQIGTSPGTKGPVAKP